VTLFATLTVTALPVLVQAGPACGPDEEAVRAVCAVATDIIAADNARDIERVLGYYTADANLMPPGEEAVSGIEAIRPRYERLFSKFNPRIEARVDGACVSTDLAFVRGHNGGRLVPLDGSEALELDDVYLMVLRREEDGGWRISHLMWHPANAGSPTPRRGRR
jgi:uncharacterized protein (TIGR02246 family)